MSPARFAHTIARARARRILLPLVAALWLVGLATPSPGATVRFAVIGDYGVDTVGEGDVARLVKSWSPDFVITVGDNNYPAGAASTIDVNIGKYYHDFIYPYMGSYGAGAAYNRFFPTLGNHDWGDTYPNPTGDRPYLAYFALPGNERYYDFTAGPVGFYAIDSDKNEPDGRTSSSVQAAWLRSRLSAATAPWRIVYFHHAPYTSGKGGATTAMRWPFSSWGASVVLAGHIHVYERVMVSGFAYITNGLGGASTASFGTPTSGSVVRYNSDFGAQLVTASDEQMSIQFITRTGLLVDTYTMQASVPTAPTDLAASAISGSEIDLVWTDQSSIEDGYYVERSTDGASYATIAALGPNVNAYQDTGCSPGTQYFYRVRAYRGSATSAYSNVATATSLSTGPAAPSSLVAAAVSANEVDLGWTDNSSDEDGFSVERSTDAVRYSQVGTVGPNVTAYADTGLGDGTTYYYRVRAYNAGGPSGPSNVASATTPALPPAAPSGLTAVGTSSSRIDLAWTDNATNESGFEVERSADGISFGLLATLAANTSAYADTGLPAATTYTYRVRAVNTAGASAYTDPASATTTSTPPVTTTLGPVADSFVRDGTYADTNYGTLGTFYTETIDSTGYRRDAYLKFDLGGVSGTLSSARLRLWVTSNDGSSVPLGAYAVSDGTWTESGLTWNNRPALGSLLGSVPVSGTAYGWYEWDVTAYLQGELAAGRTLVSLGLHDPAASPSFLRGATKEFSTLANRPQLVVTTN